MLYLDGTVSIYSKKHPSVLFWVKDDRKRDRTSSQFRDNQFKEKMYAIGMKEQIIYGHNISHPLNVDERSSWLFQQYELNSFRTSAVPMIDSRNIWS